MTGHGIIVDSIESGLIHFTNYLKTGAYYLSKGAHDAVQSIYSGINWLGQATAAPLTNAIEDAVNTTGSQLITQIGGMFEQVMKGVFLTTQQIERASYQLAGDAVLATTFGSRSHNRSRFSPFI